MVELTNRCRVAISQARLMEVHHFDPETNIWTKLQKSRRVKIGAFTPNVSNRGYETIRIDGVRYLAHRLAWLYVHGAMPDGEIDHINGDKRDNRISNLRVVSHRTNQENQRRPRKNTATGFLGVVKDKKKYVAQIGVAGKNIRLGVFDDPAVAHQAYLRAKRELHIGNTL